MPKPQITHVSDYGGDWEAYYIDGKLIAQTHTVAIWEVMQALSDVVSFTEFEADAETVGHFPDNLEEVVRDHEE